VHTSDSGSKSHAKKALAAPWQYNINANRDYCGQRAASLQLVKLVVELANTAMRLASVFVYALRTVKKGVISSLGTRHTISAAL